MFYYHISVQPVHFLPVEVVFLLQLHIVRLHEVHELILLLPEQHQRSPGAPHAGGAANTVDIVAAHTQRENSVGTQEQDKQKA